MPSLKKGIGWYILTLGLFTLAIVLLPDIDRLIPASITQILWLGFLIIPVIIARDNKKVLGLTRIKWQVRILAFSITATVSFTVFWFDTGGALILPELSVTLFYGIILAPIAEEVFLEVICSRYLKLKLENG
jgi:membrane protease YdiL (CAAX protease family)